MDLILKLSGQRCDLSLHPVSPKTVERIGTLGRKFYAKKYIHWWRNGNTSTCGMKYGDDCAVQVSLGGQPVDFDASAIPDSAVLLRRRHYLESKARYLALLGYDDEHCTMHWIWRNVTSFDPARFDFFVHRWDRVLGEQDFLIVDDVRYNGSFADEQDWGGSCGFSLVDPRIIDLDVVRREMGIETVAAAHGADASAESPEELPLAPSAKATPFIAGKGPYVRPVAHANAVGERSCTVCKDSIRVELRIENEVIVDAGGMAEGCDYSKECLAALARMVIGKSIYDCYPITNEDLHEHLTRVMPKLDCDYFTVGALKLALRNWEKAAA
ncbi:iron-sulfur cluster assembly scaffold protein [Fundidesulfovibrio terrae]|uniref:iron-sulfur cluster assembly scaffold protein n=1 Tax=Fundidesulfovibrio terrae TaxID=2922866 RepID=UPI001FAF60D2|nr:iron-sulfur cluster assembly scaffold protein [Fundidesulfovibrio terrae]